MVLLYLLKTKPVISEGVSLWFQSCCWQSFEDVFLQEAEVVLVVAEVGGGEGGEDLLPHTRISGQDIREETGQLAVRQSSEGQTGAEIVSQDWREPQPLLDWRPPQLVW